MNDVMLIDFTFDGEHILIIMAIKCCKKINKFSKNNHSITVDRLKEMY